MPASFHQSLGNDFVELKTLMDSATEFLENQGVDTQAVFRINLSLEEIVTNVIKYGHAAGDHPHINVTIDVGAQEVRALIVDEGREFNPVVHQKTKPHEILAERVTGGLGIHLIKRLLDGMVYRREGNRNVVEVKTLRKPSASTS